MTSLRPLLTEYFFTNRLSSRFKRVLTRNDITRSAAVMMILMVVDIDILRLKRYLGGIKKANRDRFRSL
jgi:hypothetical protein